MHKISLCPPTKPSPKNQFPFKTPLDQWPQKPASTMTLWLRRNIPFIKFYRKVSRTQQDT
eukprot:6052667-Ditylum_brightwellii.AAC.2